MPNLVAISMVRNEEDIIRRCLVNLYRAGVRSFVIADNRSSDSTVAECETFKEMFGDAVVVIVRDPVEGHLQSRTITALAKFASSYFSTPYIYPFDADEFLVPPQRAEPYLLGTAPARTTAAGDLSALLFGDWDFLSLDWMTCVEAPDGSVLATLRPSKWGKVLIRWQDDMLVEPGNHRVSSTSMRRFSSKTRRLVRRQAEWKVLHFPVRSSQQLKAKILEGGLANKVNAGKVGMHWNELYKAYQRHGTMVLDQLYALIASPSSSHADLATFVDRFVISPDLLGYFSDYFEPRLTIAFSFPCTDSGEVTIAP